MLHEHSELLRSHQGIEQAIDNDAWSVDYLIKLCQKEYNEEVRIDYNEKNLYYKAYMVLADNLKPITIRGSQYDLKLALADLLIHLRDYKFFCKRQKDAAGYFNYVEEG